MESQQRNGNLDLKRRVARMKMLLHELNSRFERAEEKFTELEDRAIEIMQSKGEKC